MAAIWSWKRLKRTLKLQKDKTGKICKTGISTTASSAAPDEHLCFKFLGQKSNYPQENGSTSHSVLTLFFLLLFSPKKCDNSKHTNLIFFFPLWKAEDSSVKSNLVLSFRVIFGTCRVKPVAFAEKSREGQMLTTTPLRGNETIFLFSSQCSKWRAVRQAEWKGQRSQCSTAKDFTPQWHEQHPRQPDEVPPPAARHHIAFAGYIFFFFSRWNGGRGRGRFIH